MDAVGDEEKDAATGGSVIGGIKTIVFAVRGLVACVGCVLVRVGAASFLVVRQQLLGDLLSFSSGRVPFPHVALVPTHTGPSIIYFVQPHDKRMGR